MFDFLNFFQGGTSLLAASTSIFNTYANFRAGKERIASQMQEQRHRLRLEEEHARFDKKQLSERTAEYSAISSYHIDMLRQDQLHARQNLSYNILNSGIGITQNDSAGLLLRHMAYMDEMKARSVEAEYFHNRPRSSLNPAMLELNKEAANRNIKFIKSASPWVTAGTILKGVRELGDISRAGE